MELTTEDNKRQHERVTVAFALMVREGDRLLGTIEDISEGGMRVRLDVDIGENSEVREWTGNKGVDNKEFVMVNLVGEVFTLSIDYMRVRLGTLSAKLIRVIRSMNNVYFAMQFTAECDPEVPKKIMTIIKRRKGD
ncbi:MAG: PilZ domain-containing protein [Candidatus Hydrogenedentota bacterium]